MDHEEQFIQDMADAETEMMDALRRGWQAGEVRSESAPHVLTVRVQQLVASGYLPKALEDKQGGDFPCIDHAAALLSKQPVQAGLWHDNISLDFGDKDNDNPDFVVAFLLGLTFPGRFDEFFASQE